MSDLCNLIVFSNKAYNAIIRESFDKDPVETGGILLGHVLDNGAWIVMEVLPPGINSIFQYAYFEYDEQFVNYLAQSVANQYKRPLDLLGLWHRHPGSMDFFSSTDDGTNTTFARQNPAGVISGLVNIDPSFRLTMYHLDQPSGRISGRPEYTRVDVEVGDDLIPDEFHELRYFNDEDSNPHPRPEKDGNERQINRRINQSTPLNPSAADLTGQPHVQTAVPQRATPKFVDDFFLWWRASNKRWTYLLAAIVVLLVCIYTAQIAINKLSSFKNEESKQETVDPKEKSEERRMGNPSLSVDKLTLTKVGDSKKIEIRNHIGGPVKWSSSNPGVADVSNGTVVAVSEGYAEITAHSEKYHPQKPIGSCKVTVSFETSRENPPSASHPDEEIIQDNSEQQEG